MLRFSLVLSCVWLTLFNLFIANEAQAHGSIHKKIAELSDQIKNEPHNAELYLKRGLLLHLHLEWKPAIADFRKAEKLDLNEPNLNLYYAQCWLTAGKSKKGLKAIEQFIEAQPQSIPGRQTRARLNIQLGKNALASQDLEWVVENTSNPLPSNYIEWAESVSGDQTNSCLEAANALDEGLKRLGFVITLAQKKLDLLTSCEQFEEALTAVDDIILQIEKNESWLVQKANLLIEVERFDEAESVLLNAQKKIDELPRHKKTTPHIKELELEIELLKARISSKI